MKKVSSPQMMWRYLKQRLFFSAVWFAAAFLTVVIATILGFILINGIGAISWEFITEPPKQMMTKGGVMPAIVGTFYLTCGALLVALPLGVAAAIYLSEYAKDSMGVHTIRVLINCLAGVPSVVFGLFGLGFFVVFLGFGSSILAGSLTLGCLILPTIIAASEEAIKAVPQTFREASLALGVSKWQTIFKIVLPAAAPGLVTGSILSVGRAAGETAPIMFTAATFFTTLLPRSVFDEVMALPYHIYVLATAGTYIYETRPLQYGAVLVLITIIFAVNISAILIRIYARKNKRW